MFQNGYKRDQWESPRTGKQQERNNYPREDEHPSLGYILQVLPEKLSLCSYLAGPCASLDPEM